jgi:hypothetical protein
MAGDRGVAGWWSDVGDLAAKAALELEARIPMTKPVRNNNCHCCAGKLMLSGGVVRLPE